MPVFEFTEGREHPQMYAYLLVRPSSDIARLDTLTLVQPSTGYHWVIHEPVTMTVRESSWVSGAKLAPEDPAEGFTEGDYTVVYTDSSERVSQIEVPLNYVPDYLESTTATFQTLMPGNATAKLAVYNVEGHLLFYGARTDELQTDDAIKARFPAVFSWREIVSPPNNATAVLLPMRYAEIQAIPAEITADYEAPQPTDEPPDLGTPASDSDSTAADTAADSSEEGESLPPALNPLDFGTPPSPGGQSPPNPQEASDE
jgi:hypothetical protein